MNYAEIKYCDIANGPGVRTTLFVSGCRHRCPGCFNEVTWDFAAGRVFSPEAADEVVASLEPTYVTGLSVLGGEPLEPESQPAVLALLGRVRAERSSKTVWMYTGFTWEELHSAGCRAHTEILPRILGLVDVLVDGPFVAAQKDITLRFRGSSNQRIIDVAASLEAGHVVEWEDLPEFSTHEWS